MNTGTLYEIHPKQYKKEAKLINNWIPLQDNEYKRVWDKFDKDFSFKPSIYPKDWPTFSIHGPYITFEMIKNYKEEEINELEEVCKTIFKSCLEPHEYLYALDWQHESFYYSPYLQEASPRILFYPDGDYYLFLKKDFSFGYLGHPWEQSITIFGEELVQKFITHKPNIFDGIIRRSSHLQIT
ncbi:DUF2716 domain-containing protein [Paenibacillus amylolyticus]|uniref:DUF2716 domain-containing protein n=1 Tax=Paenibacillus amylolyticus TaxID=1451 RepID=UPI001F37118E|nr:DUF2716 domain-containing protein [Paenibacillus amylolyticus]